MSPITSASRRAVHISAIAALACSAPLLRAGGFAGYQEPVRWFAGQQPSDVQAADLNGDGRCDMLAVDEASSMLTPLRGLGDGTFETLGGVRTVLIPKALALADLNGDHRPDAAVVSACGSQLAVHMNLGDGTFGPATFVDLGALGDSIVAGDFNGDGHVDLFVAHIYALRLTLLTGDGLGGLHIDRTFSTPYYPWSIEAADINDDHITDLGVGLLSGGQTNFIRAIIADGKGGFFEPLDSPSVRQPVDIAFGHFDRDGLLDCATIDTTAGLATVFYGAGNGSFFDARNYSFPGRPEEIEAIDVDRNGVDDLVAVHSYFHRVTTMIADGSGNFLEPVWQDLNADARDLAHGDFNGDGFDDVVAGYSFQGSDVVCVLLNRSLPGVSAQLLDVKATDGQIIFGPIEDIQRPDNVQLRARASDVRPYASPETIELRIDAQSDHPKPQRLNLAVLSQTNREGSIEQTRLLNRFTNRFDTVMVHNNSKGEALHQVRRIDAKPYVDANGHIEISIRYAASPQSGFNLLECYVDWVDVSVE